MTTSYSSSKHLSSLVLAGVLLATLGLLALRAHAEEGRPPAPLLRGEKTASSSNPVRMKAQEFGEKREALRTEQKVARDSLKESMRSRVLAMRAASSTPEERQALRAEIRAEIENARTEDVAERQVLRATYVEELHKAIDTRRTEVEARKVERQARASTTRAERRASSSVAFLERTGATLSALGERMSSTMGHLSGVADTLEKRILSLEGAGTSLSEARSALSEVRTALEKTSQDIATFKVLVADTLSSADPKAGMADVRASGQLVRDDIEAVRAGILNTTDLVRLAVQGTSTATHN